MRVDVLCEFGSLNGGERSLLTLLPLLRERGVDFRILVPPEGDFPDALRLLGFSLIPFEAAPGTSLSGKQELLGRILWKSTPQLLHANSVSTARLSGPVVRMGRIPSIGHLRDIIRLNRTMISDLNKHRRLLAVSEATRRFHVEQGLHPETCQVLYNGIDLRQFRPRAATGSLHRELGLAESTKLLTVIGQIGLRKGQDFLLESLEPLFEARNDVCLLVVGRRWSEKEESVRFEQSLRDRASVAPFAGRIRFLGLRDDIPDILNESALLVHPARQEPLGRVLLEAAASGTPVVATDVGGTAEIFPNSRYDKPVRDRERNESARLVSPKSPDLFRAAVYSLLEHAGEAQRIGRNARERAETVFSHRRAAELLFRHYEEVFQGD